MEPAEQRALRPLPGSLTNSGPALSRSGHQTLHSFQSSQGLFSIRRQTALRKLCCESGIRVRRASGSEAVFLAEYFHALSSPLGVAFLRKGSWLILSRDPPRQCRLPGPVLFMSPLSRPARHTSGPTRYNSQRSSPQTSSQVQNDPH